MQRVGCTPYLNILRDELDSAILHTPDQIPAVLAKMSHVRCKPTFNSLTNVFLHCPTYLSEMLKLMDSDALEKITTMAKKYNMESRLPKQG